MRSILGLVVALPLIGGMPPNTHAQAQTREVAVLRSTTGVRPEPGSVLRQRARLIVDGVSLATALTKLSETSKVSIAFSPNTLPGNHRVGCSCEAATVAAALDHLLSGTSFGYVVLDDQVLVSRKPTIDAEGQYVPSVVVAASNGDVNGQRAYSVLRTALTGPLPSQAGSVAGTVFDARAMRPLAEVQVSVLGLATSPTRTDARGRFLIENIAGPTASLRFVAVGYRPLTRSVSVGDLNLRIMLEDTPLKLDELVVTGTPGAVQRRSLGNAVATINATAVLDDAPVNNVSNMINGRVAGVIVTPGTGVVGSGGTISIRGKGSLSLETQPLVYIDGIRVDNNPFSGPNMPAGQAISRLNDVNPQDIESIQIIKGPAAATLYGTEAAKGVIQIITKKGKVGATTYDATVDQGANWFMSAEERMPTNYARNAQGQVVSSNVTQLEAAAGRPIFTTGHVQRYRVSASGGTPTTRYYIGGAFNRDEGIEPTNFQRRFSGRLNVTIAPNPNFDLTATLGLVTGTTDLPREATTGVWFSAFTGSPLTLTTPRRGFQGAPSDVWHSGVIRVFQNLNRFTAGAQINHRPRSWLTQRLAVGLDQADEDNQHISQRMTPDFAQFFNSADAAGFKALQRRDITTNTFDYAATATIGLSKQLKANSSVGAQYYRRLIRLASASGNQFPAPDLTTIAAAAQTFGSDDFIENATLGVYGQQQFAWKDRAFVTVAIRGDDNSAFGENFNFVTYPKVSGAWIVSEEPFWPLRFVNALKLRGAFGASGQQPDAFAAFRSYAAITGPGDAPGITPQFVGNPDLKPERGEEIELGFEAGLFKDRVGLDFTYYSKTTRDAILLRQVAPSTGFPGQQFFNAGKISNRGVELAVSATAVQSRWLDLDLAVTLSRNRNKIVDLGEQSEIQYSRFPPAQLHKVGFPVAGFFAKRVVSATLDATGRATNLQCDGGIDGLPGGPPVACGQAPRVYLGQAQPKAEGAVSARLTLFDRLRVYGLVDFKVGHRRFNVNGWGRCSAFGLCEESFFPERFDPARVAEVQQGGGLVLTSSYVEKASFAKLRELSVTYSFPDRWARSIRASRLSIAVAGRNLHTWTKYSGLDPESQLPEIDVPNANRGNYEQFLTPQLAQILTTINITF